MKSPAELLAPLGEMSDEELIVWVAGLAHERPSRPEFPYPRDYRTAADFLIAVLYQMQDQAVLVRFGNATGEAFQRFLGSGGYVPEAVKKDRGEVASNFLFLVEALPSGREQAKGLVYTLVSMLCSPALRAFPSPEVDLQKRLLLALPGKLDVAECYEPDVPKRLRDDLRNPTYAAAAFATSIRLSPAHAAEDLRTALKTLQETGHPTAQLLSDLVLAIAKHPIDHGAIFAALADAATDRVKQEFRDELIAFSRNDLLTLWNKTFPESGLPTVAIIGPVRETGHKIELILTRELKKPGLPSTDDAQRETLATNFGSRIAATMVDNWESAGKKNAELFDVPWAQSIVQALDNGIWNGRSAFHDTTEFPNWFLDRTGRREFAARSIRESVRWVAFFGKWKMNEAEFSEIVERLDLDHYMAEIAALLPDNPSERAKLSLTVSPFPEDQLLFLVLKTAGGLRSRILFEARPAPWADRNSLDADCSLINELAIPRPVSEETDPSHDVFRHEGYFVFADKPGPTISKDRIKLALDSGLKRYDRGEYKQMNKRLEKVLKVSGKSSDPAPAWPVDFESFILGGHHIYVGGSINSRLLFRLWGDTGRIHAICNPRDFSAVLTRMPTNRLVLGPEFRKRLGQTNSRSLLPKLVGLYKEVGKFLHQSADSASKGDHQGQAIVRHFMHTLAQGIDQQKDGFWNFVVSEQDMCSLILEDNNFILDDEDALTTTAIRSNR